MKCSPGQKNPDTIGDADWISHLQTQTQFTAVKTSGREFKSGSEKKVPEGITIQEVKTNHFKRKGYTTVGLGFQLISWICSS